MKQFLLRFSREKKGMRYVNFYGIWERDLCLFLSKVTILIEILFLISRHR